MDAYLNTGSTNFDKTIVALVLKQVQANLRGGLVWTPKGSVIPAQLVPGSNGTFRSVGYDDLPEDGQVDLEHGDADPTVEDLGISFVEFTGKQSGRTVGVEDTARDRSPHNLAAIAAQKIAWDISVAVDNIPRKLYAAAPSLFGGSGITSAGNITNADKMTAALLKDAVALMRMNNVPTLAGGLYAFVADPFVIRDLTSDDEYIDEMKMADPSTFLTGQVGKYAGCAIINAGSRGNWIADSGSGVDSGGDTLDSAGSLSSAPDVHYPTLIGADAVFAALGGLKVYTVTTPDHGDPLNRRDLFSWKGFLGGVLNDVESERFITLAVGSTL
jgi:N4-gp56 family major capsid protein